LASNGVNSFTTVPKWESNAAYWIQIIRDNRDRYRLELTNGAVLRAIGQCEGLQVLDAGCGEGYMSRQIADLGADVTGLDLSVNLIDAARSSLDNAEKSIRFDVGDVSILPYESSRFDLVLCNHLINDLPEPEGAISEFSRVLRPAGRVVILMLHPCFYARPERNGGTDDSGTIRYFDRRRAEQHFNVDGLISPATNTVWLRPLEYHTESLRNAGFVIESLVEPHPTAEQLAKDPWWQKAFTRPLFMLITARLA
jgi:SAM-dependent methyltransferase